jgi:hypothetical protein
MGEVYLPVLIILHAGISVISGTYTLENNLINAGQGAQTFGVYDHFF